jgi:hypothetical protein
LEATTSRIATNIENMHLSRKPDLIEEVLRRPTAANMELVNWSKIINRYAICRLAPRDDSSADGLSKTP